MFYEYRAIMFIGGKPLYSVCYLKCCMQLISVWHGVYSLYPNHTMLFCISCFKLYLPRYGHMHVDSTNIFTFLALFDL